MGHGLLFYESNLSGMTERNHRKYQNSWHRLICDPDVSQTQVKCSNIELISSQHNIFPLSYFTYEVISVIHLLCVSQIKIFS